MSEISDFIRNVSLRLSKILDEIGVNERIVIKRRRLQLMNDTLRTIGQQLLINKDVNVYSLGSRVEGTTTIGLNSDIDVLFTLTSHKVIQDWSEWEPGKRNLLMIQDNTVSQGYCLLQVLRNDVPLPEQNVCYQSWYKDRKGKVLFQNAIVNPAADVERVRRHGPAQSFDGKPGSFGQDLVFALTCQQWPSQARQWMNQQVEYQWPTNDMKQYCKGTGCFVVGVGGKGSDNEELEWRISTSLAERHLMFTFNMTQIRCYVLMKMILKTFITAKCPDSISSFMCKTVMFYCISSTHSIAWNGNTLLICLNYCLTLLYSFVLNEYCPHFIIPDNNLMARRFTPVTKYVILDIRCYIISSKGSALLETECDRLGFRIQNTFLRLGEIVPEYISCEISGQVVKNTARCINAWHTHLPIAMNKNDQIRIILQSLYKYMMILTRYMNQKNKKLACIVIAKFLSMHLGTTLASITIQSEGVVCRESTVLMSLVLSSDVASG